MSIEEEYQKVINTFPQAQIIDGYISHITIPLGNGIVLEINFKNYPKRPKVILVRPDGQVYNNLNSMVSTLKYWNKKDPLSIVDLISDITMLLNSSISREIAIKKELIDGIIGLCKAQHPNEILGFLRVEDGIASEYILLPGAITNETSGVFSPGRVPFDPTLEGSVHSHPSGVPYPSKKDLEKVFMSKRFNFIVGYPYTYNSTRCFDQKGNELNFIIVD